MDSSPKKIGKRIFIIGCSSSGKTTLGKKLAENMGLSHSDLDDFYWLENWQSRSKPDFIQNVQNIIEKDSWVISGNYSSVFDYIWQKSDSVIWLDYSFLLVLWRGIKRSLSRVITNEKVCNNNYESFRNIFRKESTIRWICASYAKNRMKYNKYFDSNSSLNRELFHFKTPKLLQLFISNL